MKLKDCLVNQSSSNLELGPAMLTRAGVEMAKKHHIEDSTKHIVRAILPP
jgi:hypothetical protein